MTHPFSPSPWNRPHPPSPPERQGRRGGRRRRFPAGRLVRVAILVLGVAMAGVATRGLVSGSQGERRVSDRGSPGAAPQETLERGAVQRKAVQRKTVQRPAGGATSRENVTASNPSVRLAAAAATRTSAATAPPSIGRARVPGDPRAVRALGAELGATIAGSTRGGSWGAMVLSLTTGDTLYSLNAEESMQPASTMKLMTTALVLDRFGPDHRFRTEVLRAGRLDADGTLQGDLIIRGTGDPGFSGRYLGGRPAAAVDLLAQLVAGAGVRRVTGRVVGDATAFESRLVPAGWKESYLHLAYAAPVSALSINENLVWINFEPGAASGPARVSFDPASSGVPLTSTVRTRAGAGSSVTVVKLPGGGMEARGWIGTKSAARRLQMVITEPALFTTGAFREALVRAGIEVQGGSVLGATPAGAEPVTSLPSATVAQLVAAMNRESINHFAELLFRNAARGEDGKVVGSAESGDAALHAFLTGRVGTTANAVVAADGSGLSLMDRVTPRAMTRLLAYAHDAPWGSVFHASLPVAGESELLRHRMRSSPASGNLHAKTGTTDDVIALAGYTTAEDGEVLAFTFIYNGRDRWKAREAIDRMGELLSAYSGAAPAMTVAE